MDECLYLLLLLLVLPLLSLVIPLVSLFDPRRTLVQRLARCSDLKLTRTRFPVPRLILC